jgi:cytoskeletal protein RodZ
MVKTIGEALKAARTKKRFSLAKLEKATKIKKEFIEAIEKESWEKLPEYPVVVGFVKNIAKTLKFNQRQATALLRRDYPPKSLRINPKPDVSDKFSWSPRLTFLAGVIAVSIIVFAYLGFQYVSFISPPELQIESPRNEQIVHEEILSVTGTTDPEATVKVNNQPVLVDEDGSFVAEIEIFEGTVEVEIVAKSRSGKETVVRRKIIPELE